MLFASLLHTLRLSQLSYTTQEPRNVATFSGTSPLTSITSQGNGPQTCTQANIKRHYSKIKTWLCTENKTHLIDCLKDPQTCPQASLLQTEFLSLCLTHTHTHTIPRIVLHTILYYTVVFTGKSYADDLFLIKVVFYCPPKQSTPGMCSCFLIGSTR